ncbi:MAG: energy-coupling factor transporter transmembrane component T [Chloroflexota bacterium]|nr:energy-coupling factor transporter transmembrane protein EcfT [Anaerolineae bacterium]
MRHHVLSWSLWALAALMPTLMTRNPLYLLITVLAVALGYAQHQGKTEAAWGTFLRAGLMLWVLTVPFNALFVHHGDIVIFSLPRSWPLIGGPITLEAVIYGTVSGLALFTILLIFATYNVQVSHYELLRHTPGFLYQASLVTSIAVTFVPQMIASAKDIREAQMIRGHKFRKLRDMLPLFMPLLTSGLERAVQLAESMESRGFGGNLAPVSWRQAMAQRLATLLGLVGLLVGLLLSAYFPQRSQPGWIIAGIGGVLLLGVFRAQGRRVQRSRYRHSTWSREDTIIATTSALVIGIFTGMKLMAPQVLGYYPYPPFSLIPDFNPFLGGILLLLAVPALLYELSPDNGPRLSRPPSFPVAPQFSRGP